MNKIEISINVIFSGAIILAIGVLMAQIHLVPYPFEFQSLTYVPWYDWTVIAIGAIVEIVGSRIGLY